MKTAIIGLPMVGKTSLFTILTGVHEVGAHRLAWKRASASPRFPTRALDALAKLFEPPKITHATVEYLDFPAISKEALRDPQLSGQPARRRRVGARAARLRRATPCRTRRARSIRCAISKTSRLELILSDLVVVEKRMERLDKDRKKIKSPELDQEFALLERAKAELEANRPLRELELSAEDEKRIRGFQFLSQKPMLCVLNLGEEDAARLHEIEEEYRKGRSPGARTPRSRRSAARSKPNWPSSRGEEAREYLASYGLKESGLERLISATYSLLGLMSFLTAGETEVPRLDHSRSTARP